MAKKKMQPVESPVEESVTPIEPEQPESVTEPSVDLTAANKALTISTGSVTIMSRTGEQKEEKKNTVTVKISYPENFTGKRFLKQGQEYEVSAETAQLFLTKGIARVIKHAD